MAVTPFSLRHQRSLRAGVGVLLDTAERCCSHHHLPAAGRLAKQAALVSPGRGRAWFLLGRVAAMTGNEAAARDHLERAASLCPGRPGFRLAAGLALIDARPGDAIQHLRAAVGLCPSWVRARVALACALSAMGCDEDASYWADALLPEDPGEIGSLDAVAWADLSDRRPENQALEIAA